MKYLYSCWLLLSVLASAPADGPSLQTARQRWLRGNYEEARAQYETLAKDAAHRAAAAIGLSRTQQSQGEYDKSLATIDAALRDLPQNADLLARRAELLYLRGRWEDAEQGADKALAVQKEHFLARWIRAQIYRDRGDMAKADAECRWFVRTYSERSDKDNDIKDPDLLLLVGLAGCENARWNKLADQFPFILNEVYGDALKLDKDLWLAEFQAGMLLLEKYNRGEALAALDKALAINPHAAEVLAGKGIAALQKLEIKDAEEFAHRALDINPNLPEARRLQADVHLAGGDIRAALRDLERARTINPRDEVTLGRIAACLYLQQKNDQAENLARDVLRYDAKPGLFYFTLGEQLEERRRFDLAEKYYKQAIELRPMLVCAPNSLGLLYMRLGRETEARDILTKAFEADAFNVRVSNTLKVLRHLDKYETLKTAHFELRFDPKNDRQLAQYMAPYLEAIYTELAELFQYRPAGPILVEVFNNHEMFSGRTIALPDLHTIGACTGRMVAMVSPRGKGMAKPFNWLRVLRHELVHIFNLEQTRFQVPHWFTEGLAVVNENYPRPQQWNQLLLERVPSGELMNLDDIDLGFIRPRTQDTWHLAYCQSQLYVEYLKDKYGPQAIGALLTAFRDGLDSAAAVERVCRVDKETFEKGYQAYVKEAVRAIKSRPAEKTMTLEQLRKAHEADPEDADVAARLAEQYQLRRRNAEARKLVEGVLANKKTHPLAAYVKARLVMAAGEEEEALRLLQAAVDPKAPEPKVLKALGKLYFDARDFSRAAQIFELGRKAEPLESQWLVELVKVYAQGGDKTKQMQALRELVPTNADDLDLRKQLAQLLLEGGQFSEAEKYARQALEIDVLDSAAQEALYKALRGQNKDSEAERVRQVLAK